MLALCQARDSRMGMFAIPAGTIERMETVAAIADLGLPVYREMDLPVDNTGGTLDWVLTRLVAPSGPSGTCRPLRRSRSSTPSLEV